MVDGFANNLLQHQFAAAKQLVCEYADIFSRHDFDLGHCDILPNRIDTGNVRPFKEQLRRHPIARLDFIDEQVKQMLQAGVVEPSASPGQVMWSWRRNPMVR